MEAGSQRAPELSAIILGYRAGKSLLRVAEPLVELLDESGVTYELVLVANYWSGEDETPAVAEEFARTHPWTTAVVRPKEGAMGWDMRSGFAAPRGDYLVVIDGDAQNPVDDVLRMYTAMRETGRRRHEGQAHPSP